MIFLKICFYYFWYVNVCISVYIRTVCECWWPEALGPLELKLHGCESPDIGAGKHSALIPATFANVSHLQTTPYSSTIWAAES